MNKVSSQPNEATLREALRSIMDPELNVSIVDLGLIYNIEIDEKIAKITMTLTTIGCPLFQTIENDIREKVLTIEGIETVEIDLTFNPPWDTSRISPEAKAELGILE